uniref:Uncharacterized protein n=1 Tax=Ditylenchus dipsaci TaxID=166011 RepID=A0A915D5V0_9BILA
MLPILFFCSTISLARRISIGQPEELILETLNDARSSLEQAEEGALLCRQAYWQRIHQMCTFPDQLWPCLKGSRYFRGKVHHVFDIEVVAMQACQGSISLNDINQSVCCSTADCLENATALFPI